MSTIMIVSDLRARFGEARDQKSRPTCLVFASSDAHSFAIGIPWNPLSCEYLFFHAKKSDGSSPHRGTNVASIAATLKAEGQPREGEWPYLPKLPADLSTWIPPTIGNDLHRAEMIRIAKPNTGDIWIRLENGEPVVIGITLSDAFYALNAEGVIDSDEPAETARKHALAVVAIGTEKTDRFFLVRNSWGDKWGLSGYAWLSERYLKPRLIVAARLQVTGGRTNYV